MHIKQNKAELRQHIRNTRAALPSSAKQQAQVQATKRLLELLKLLQSQRVALYHATAEELGTSDLIQQLWAQNIALALPRIHPFTPRHLLFQNYTPKTTMIPNRFHIQEPKLDSREVISLETIDTFILPLVAFDAKGHRLGMGGGYYDCTLAQHALWQPALIGFAFDEQEVKTLQPEPWDVRLTHLVTPTKTCTFATV
tara:strand:- start:11999 stop:12592 length:594 start_codon:yes stop_codon:yes gene_type:complete